MTVLALALLVAQALVLAALWRSHVEVVKMSQQMDALVAEVGELTSIIDSAVALIQGISAQVADAAGDHEKSLALAAELDAKGNALAAAVAANTPPAPPAPTEG